MIAILRVFWAFLARDLSVATSYKLQFLLRLAAIVFPVLVLYLPAKLIGDSLESTREFGGFLPFSIVGLGVMNFFMSSYGAFASSLRNEQSMGTLESLLMTPVRVSTLVLASSSWSFLWSTLSAVLFIGGGALVYGITFHGSLALAFAVVLLTTLVFVSMGILSASFTMVWKRGDPIGPLVSITFFLLGGVVYPTRVLPHWLADIAQVLPITHSVRAIRAILLLGRSAPEIMGEIALLALYALILVPVSLWAFTWAVRKAQQDGTLLQY